MLESAYIVLFSKIAGEIDIINNGGERGASVINGLRLQLKIQPSLAANRLPVKIVAY